MCICMYYRLLLCSCNVCVFVCVLQVAPVSSVSQTFSQPAALASFFSNQVCELFMQVICVLLKLQLFCVQYFLLLCDNLVDS